jgi:hypothetical protein
MKVCALVFVLVLSASFQCEVWADGGPPSIGWKGWSVSSSEGFDLESGGVPKFPLRYPLTNMFDGDPATTWVFEDGQRRNTKARRVAPLRPSLNFTPEQPVVMDSLWLMNGYNRRRDLFLRNDRIVKLGVEVNRKKIKEVILSDRMGWHKISLPRQRVEHLMIKFTDIRKGEGADNDICVSEVALFDRGRQIDVRMPQTVVYRLSACCGGTGYLLRRGHVIINGGFGEGIDLIWNSSGKLVGGISGDSSLWVADAERARILRRFKLPDQNGGYISDMNWKDNRTIEITYYNGRGKSSRKQYFRAPNFT